MYLPAHCNNLPIGVRIAPATHRQKHVTLLSFPLEPYHFFNFILDVLIIDGSVKQLLSLMSLQPTDNRIFTISGQLIETSSQLRPGIYIQNGRKFIIK